MVSWSEATERRGLEAPPLAFRRCVIPETGDRKADLRIGPIWEDVKFDFRLRFQARFQAGRSATEGGDQ